MKCFQLRHVVEELHDDLARSNNCWQLRHRDLRQIRLGISPAMSWNMVSSSCHPSSDRTYLELPLCSAATSLPCHHMSRNNDAISHRSVSLRPCSSSCCAQPTIPAFKHHCQHIRKCDVSSLLTNLRLLVADHHPPDRPRTSQSCQQHHVSRASVLSSKARIHFWVHWCPCRKLPSALQLL